MTSGFTGKNCCAVVATGIVLGLMIAASVGSWYTNQIEYQRELSANVGSGDASSGFVNTRETTLNSTKMWYDLQGVKTEFQDAAGVKTSNYDNFSSSNGSIKSIFKTCQAFVLIALLASVILLILLVAFFFDRLRNKVVFFLGMTVSRLILVVLGAIVLLCVLIAFLVFLGIVSAFKDDIENCSEGPCRTFIDSKESNFPDATGTITKDHRWHPTEGWYLTLAAVPVAAALVIVVVVNKFPLPIDSEASSGEAL